MIQRWLAVVCNWSAPLRHAKTKAGSIWKCYQVTGMPRFSSCGDWISLKMGNLLKKKNESFELEMKNYNAHETRVFTIFARCSFHMLIYYFHFNEQCTSSILSVWGRVFWWLQRWCCVCFEEVQKNWKRANTVLYLNMISMSHMMKSTICMLLHIGKLATIILHFKIKIFGMRLCVCECVEHKVASHEQTLTKTYANPLKNSFYVWKYGRFVKIFFRSRLYPASFIHSFY